MSIILTEKYLINYRDTIKDCYQLNLQIQEIIIILNL